MGGTAGRRGWSFAPGRRRAAYTAGTTPRELKSASKMGLVALLNGAETRPLMRSMSNAEVPCGATNAAVEPRATHPAASASRSGAVQGTNSASSEAEARQRTTRPEVPTSTADDPPRGRRDKRRIATRRDGESAETPRDAAGIACGAMERDIAAGRGARVVCRGGSRIPGHVIGRSTFYEDDPETSTTRDEDPIDAFCCRQIRARGSPSRTSSRCFASAPSRWSRSWRSRSWRSRPPRVGAVLRGRRRSDPDRRRFQQDRGEGRVHLLAGGVLRALVRPLQGARARVRRGGQGAPRFRREARRGGLRRAQIPLRQVRRPRISHGQGVRARPQDLTLPRTTARATRTASSPSSRASSMAEARAARTIRSPLASPTPTCTICSTSKPPSPAPSS